MLDAYCTSEELAAARPEIAVFGVGAVEQHSHHLPVGTDWIGVAELSRRVAERPGRLLGARAALQHEPVPRRHGGHRLAQARRPWPRWCATSCSRWPSRASTRWS